MSTVLVVLPLKLGLGKLARGNEENSGKSVHAIVTGDSRRPPSKGAGGDTQTSPWTRILENARILCVRVLRARRMVWLSLFILSVFPLYLL
jgi:hypothetical protein